MPAAGRWAIGAIEIARGVALAAMFADHFAWDLGFFGSIQPERPRGKPCMARVRQADRIEFPAARRARAWCSPRVMA
jgi:hypothetical protein